MKTFQLRRSAQPLGATDDSPVSALRRRAARPQSLMVAVLVVAVSALSAACSSTHTAPSAARPGGPVSVLYAATLVGTFEQDVGPAFDKATGFTFQGEGKGSVALGPTSMSALIRA